LDCEGDQPARYDGGEAAASANGCEEEAQTVTGLKTPGIPLQDNPDISKNSSAVQFEKTTGAGMAV
jgi:hypothetical protein